VAAITAVGVGGGLYLIRTSAPAHSPLLPVRGCPCGGVLGALSECDLTPAFFVDGDLTEGHVFAAESQPKPKLVILGSGSHKRWLWWPAGTLG
jgi:hypothetical protein